MKHIVRLGVGVILLAAAGLGSLQAMPAFGRKYSLSCKTCHAPFPKLNAYGEEFAGNGFVIKDKPTPRDTTDTGDPLLSLLRDIPIAFRLEGFLNYNNENSRKLDLGAPHLGSVLDLGSATHYVGNHAGRIHWCVGAAQFCRRSNAARRLECSGDNCCLCRCAARLF